MPPPPRPTMFHHSTEKRQSDFNIFRGRRYVKSQDGLPSAYPPKDLPFWSRFLVYMACMIPITIILVALPVLTKFVRQVPSGLVLKNVTFPAAWPLPALNEYRWKSAVGFEKTNFDVCQTTTVSELTVSFGGPNTTYFLSSTNGCQQGSGSQAERKTEEKISAESTNTPKTVSAGATFSVPTNYGHQDHLQVAIQMPETPSITTVLLPKSAGTFPSASVSDKAVAREPLRMENPPAQTPVLAERQFLIVTNEAAYERGRGRRIGYIVGFTLLGLCALGFLAALVVRRYAKVRRERWERKMRSAAPRDTELQPTGPQGDQRDPATGHP